jgi:hypothetical protein
MRMALISGASRPSPRSPAKLSMMIRDGAPRNARTQAARCKIAGGISPGRPVGSPGNPNQLAMRAASARISAYGRRV